jgi:hypothetical protein
MSGDVAFLVDAQRSSPVIGCDRLPSLVFVVAVSVLWLYIYALPSLA